MLSHPKAGFSFWLASTASGILGHLQCCCRGQWALTDGRPGSESKIWGCFSSMAPERHQMEPLVGKVSLALSYLWDGVTATQLGECRWSLGPANSHRDKLLQKNHHCQGFPPIFGNRLLKQTNKAIPVSLASPWQGVEV